MDDHVQAAPHYASGHLESPARSRRGLNSGMTNHYEEDDDDDEADATQGK